MYNPTFNFHPAASDGVARLDYDAHGRDYAVADNIALARWLRQLSRAELQYLHRHLLAQSSCRRPA
jgi:hypothetical protein